MSAAVCWSVRQEYPPAPEVRRLAARQDEELRRAGLDARAVGAAGLGLVNVGTSSIRAGLKFAYIGEPLGPAAFASRYGRRRPAEHAVAMPSGVVIDAAGSAMGRRGLPLPARTNHSRRPNATMDCAPGAMWPTLRLDADVPPGDEVTFRYPDAFWRDGAGRTIGRGFAREAE